MSFKKLFTARIIIIAAIVSMIALASFSFFRINRLNNLSDWVNHTNIVRVKLQETYSDISDADSELSKFLLTGDSVYLKNMYAFENRVTASLAELKSLTKDNLLQQSRVASLDSLMNSRFALMNAGLMKQGDQYRSIAAEISSLNSTTKELIGVLKNEENKLLLEREKSADKYKAWTPIAIFTIQIAIIGFLFRAYSHVAAELKIKAKLQSDLERQMRFIQAILDNSVDVIAVLDQNMNLLSANKKAFELYRIPEGSIGKYIFDIYPESKNSPFHMAALRALKGEYVHVSNLKSQVTDRAFESFFIPLLHGNQSSVLAIHHDITDLAIASKELEKRNEELRITNEQLEQFAYVTSHDLQEPLRKIQTFANLAAKKSSDTEKVLTYLTKIDDSANRMARLVRDILTYSRLSNSAGNKEMVDLDEVIKQVIQDFELTIQEKNAIIKVSNLPVVEASPQQMQQLFGNLISNSLKFCKTVPNITIDGKIQGSDHVISFSDNGIGFEQKYESHVFEVFKRLHGTSSYSGTGIGLSICKRVIDNHNGSIVVNSSPGTGTTFTITLPISPIVKQADTQMNGNHTMMFSDTLVEPL